MYKLIIRDNGVGLFNYFNIGKGISVWLTLTKSCARQFLGKSDIRVITFKCTKRANNVN